MKERVAYYIKVTYFDKSPTHRQYILPSEMYLIKTWLNDKNAVDVTVTKIQVSERDYNIIFGK